MAKNVKIPEAQQKLVDEMFLEAVELRNRERITLCIAKGANVHKRDPLTGRTALMIAVIKHPGDISFVQEMINLGIDPFVEDDDGWDVFDRAKNLEWRYKSAVMDVLLKSLPDANPAAAATGEKPEVSAADVATKETIEVTLPLAFKPRAKKGDRFDL